MPTDDELERLWRDPRNWTATGYRCAEDPRVVVPKRIAALGWTINWAHPSAKPILLMFLAIALIPALLVLVTMIASGQTDPGTAIPAVFAAEMVSLVVIVVLALRLSRARP